VRVQIEACQAQAHSRGGSTERDDMIFLQTRLWAGLAGVRVSGTVRPASRPTDSACSPTTLLACCCCLFVAEGKEVCSSRRTTLVFRRVHTRVCSAYLDLWRAGICSVCLGWYACCTFSLYLEDACVSIRLLASKTKGAPMSSQASREGGCGVEDWRGLRMKFGDVLI
jgi:hypothetical protein